MANVYTNHKVKLTTTNATTLYTVPSETTAIVKSLRVTNVDSSNDCTVAATVTDTSSVEFTIETSRNVQKGTSEELFNSYAFSTSPVVLKESEVIKLQAQNANDLHAILSVLEIS
jgi:carbohydrate-binding DOMON domain-containing protein|tara:strand:+ start:5962 stop:6306 length:345 start_codon:yes stop_codon:yes gene_type:complete